MRHIVRLLLAGPALLLSSLLLAQTPALPNEAALRARYQLASSKFIDLNGTPVHYADEGRGRPIILMHGSYASLRQWDDWAHILSRHYRVIRFDMPPAGLSGPAPDGRYDLAAELSILDGLTTALKVERFVLVATSSAVLPAAAYAADHPGRIDGLVLNNFAVSPLVFDPSSIPPSLKAAIEADKALNGYHSEDYWRQILLYSFAAKDKVTAAMAREWTDLNNRAPSMPHPSGQPAITGASFARTAGDLARITAPTLLLWSADDHETTLADHGRKALDALKASDKSLVVLPRCGHMMPLECGDAALPPTLKFLEHLGKGANPSARSPSAVPPESRPR